MNTILVDTREQKTPVKFDTYLMNHPNIAKELLILNHVLEVGDVAGSDQLFENKWGNDLLTSLNSKHLAEQLQNMHLFCIKNNLIGHLMIADTPKCHITTVDLARAVTLAQKHGIWVHYRGSILDALEYMVNMIRDPPIQQLVALPIIETKKSQLLIRQLAQIPGVTAELAEFILPEHVKAYHELYDLPIPYWDEKLTEYYNGKKMGALLARIVESL